MGSAQSRVMNVIASDDEGLAVAAVHRECVVAGLEYLAIFERDMVSTNEPHARTPALKPQSANDQVRAIHEFDVVLPVAITGRPSQERLFTVGGANNDGLLCRAFRR